ncbi:hypothetical protein [Mycobacterium sp.]|uniref:hypothetical protein n=1 Tax=Mycobacterium sp. TaxID=1785 RepID=UPI003BAB1E64
MLVYDQEGIAAGIGGLRRVLSKSESALDRIDQTQASLATISEGHAAGASQERLSQLTEIQRRIIDVTMQALAYLDLASTNIRNLDNNLAQRFFKA